MLQSVISLDLTGQDLNLTGRRLPFPTVSSRTFCILAEGHISKLLPGQLQSDAIRVQSVHIFQSRWACFRVITSISSHLRSANPGAGMEADVAVANDEQHFALKAVQSWSIRP